MLAVEDLTHAFADTLALDSVSLEIEPGEFVLLTGPNGAGKTTLVRHFNGLLEPDAGSVAVDGTPVSADPVHARTAVGMVFQNPADQFVESTVRADVAFGPENLGLARAAIEERVDRALAIVGMESDEQASIQDLSGGEQTRVALAGVLAMEPRYVVLDEPFGSLDVHARAAVLGHLDTLVASGTAVIVVTHDLRDAWDRADRVVALSDGEIVVDGRPGSNREALADLAILPQGEVQA